MLKCLKCGASYGDDKPIWRCPDCGGHLDHITEKPLSISPEEIKRGPLSMWRYGKTMPVRSPEKAVTMGEGLTPLIPVELNGVKPLVKMDFLCPTGSYKDRGISVLVSRLRELGIASLIEDSSGNAGAAMAAYCAAGGLNCSVYVPDYTSAGKCVQIEAYGAELIRVPGTREDTTDAAMAAARETYYGSHNWSPWFVEGVKTFAYEIWEQLGWTAPDHLVLPLGQGSLVLGAYRAFSELREMGLIDHIPKIHGVQSANCAPLAKAYESGLDVPENITKRETVAEGISSATPLRGAEVLEAVKRSGGSIVAVDEKPIVDGIFALASRGIYVEPTSAVVVPGISKLMESGAISKGEETVVFLSGSGLKATDKILDLRRKIK